MIQRNNWNMLPKTSSKLYETEAFGFKVTWSKSVCTVYASCTKYFPYFSNKSSAGLYC